MSRPALDVHPEQRAAADAIHYRFDLRYSGGGRREALSYDVLGEGAAHPATTYDGVLCAVVLHAMAERRDIRLHGAATGTILRNLREFQLAWARWLPDLYQPIEIEVDEVVDQPRLVPGRSIAAFSGGVDSLFTVFRHNRRPTMPPHGVDAALLVHGFDVKLENVDDFQELVERTAEIREALGLSLQIVRTNSKRLHLQTWAHSFAAELSACMHLCSGRFSEGLIGSSEPYDALVLPWGSNPVTDHLLSGGALQITHDGAAFSRTDKVAFLAQFPEAVRALKVCWEGERQGRNCGVCEKCIRTQLNFLAVGVSDPPCFDAPLDIGRIATIDLHNDALVAEFRSICEYAEQRGVEAEWLRLLRARLRRGKGDRTARAVAKDCLARLGLLGLAREVKSRITPSTARNG